MDKSLSLSMKRKVCQACVASVFLYRSERWIALRKQFKKLYILPPQMHLHSMDSGGYVGCCNYSPCYKVYSYEARLEGKM